MEEIMEKLQTDFFRGLLAQPGSTIPSFPIIFGYSVWAYSTLTKIPAYEIMKDGKKHANSQLYLANEYQLPFVVAFTDLNIIGEALGATLTYMPDVIPVHEIPAINSFEDVDNLEPANPLKDGRMPEIIKTAKIFGEKFKAPGHTLMAGSEGPITAAGSIWGMENLMRIMIKNPDLVQKVLDVASDSIVEFLNAQLEQGTEFVTLADPSASCTCISPEFFRKFAFPYYKKIVKNVDSPLFLLHICGKVQNVIKTITKIPKIMIISVDEVDMAEVKKEIGKKFIILMGNVSTSIMRYGTIQQVEEEVKRIIREAGEGGKLLISTACDLSSGTPPSNIRALMNAGKKFGNYS